MKRVMWSIVIFFSFFISLVAAEIQKPERRKESMELVFVLDRSGSMGGLEADTIGGYNAMLEKQKKEVGEVFVTTVLFDDQYEVLYHRAPIQDVKPMTQEQYYVRGMTALLDAIGKSVLTVKGQQDALPKDKKASKVLFIITTDGMENSSSEFTAKAVKELIEKQRKEFDWEFLFLGANIDAVETAKSYGIEENKAVKYHSDTLGTQKNYEVLSEAVSEIRKGKVLDESWKKEIEEDYKNRK